MQLLWPYLERNLVANHGIVSELVLITHNRDGAEGREGAARLLDEMKSRYPGVVKDVPFCLKPYGCAFDEVMVDNSTVYVKMDDDIIFIKDGSIEHLVYQQLTNKDYTFYSASVVNNPHGYGIHAFAG